MVGRKVSSHINVPIFRILNFNKSCYADTGNLGSVGMSNNVFLSHFASCKTLLGFR